MVYLGYRDLTLNNHDLAGLYSNQTFLELTCNEYAIIRGSNGEVVDKIRGGLDKPSRLNYTSIRNSFAGEIKPKDEYQTFAMDMLMDPGSTIKLLGGVFGSGK